MKTLNNLSCARQSFTTRFLAFSIVLIGIMFFMPDLVWASGGGQAAGAGLVGATSALSGLFGPIHKLISVIILLAALFFGGMAITAGLTSNDGKDSWKKFGAILVLCAIWFFAIPPFINQMMVTNDGTNNAFNSTGSTYLD